MRCLLFVLMLMFAGVSTAGCLVYRDDQPIKILPHDPLMKLLSAQAQCPTSVQSFKQLLKQSGLHTHSSMVANRGRNNPRLGSFSFFEWVTGHLGDKLTVRAGEFFFGHFTDSQQGVIFLDQQPSTNKLLIELIVWDDVKSMYNFYEMRGLDQQSTRWYYRGDSADALHDNQYLYRKTPHDSAHFGRRMRCSACHGSGGPIMKELHQPYNDWWQRERRLPLLPNVADNDVMTQMKHLSDANQLSTLVTLGMKKLDASKNFNRVKQDLSLQQQLRPLFCTTEINIRSDQGIDSARVAIPSAFWLNPLLGKVESGISRQSYSSLLQAHAMQFPETTMNDADHAWLTPVKADSDIESIKKLISDGVITKHFAESVMMIDFKHPSFSFIRCQLLQSMPSQYSSKWLSDYLTNLSQLSDEGAKQLRQYLTGANYDHAYFAAQIDNYIRELQSDLFTVTGQEKAFIKLIKLRQSVFDSEISQNPLGQILEPGFRVIFPLPKVEPKSRIMNDHGYRRIG